MLSLGITSMVKTARKKVVTAVIVNVNHILVYFTSVSKPEPLKIQWAPRLFQSSAPNSVGIDHRSSHI